MKKVISLFFLLLGVLVAYLWVMSRQVDDDSSSGVPAIGIDSVVAESPVADQVENAALDGDRAVWERIYDSEWLVSRGYVIPEQYAGYDGHTLETLAEQGDATALYLVSEKKFLNRASLKELEESVLDASLRGVSRAVNFMIVRYRADDFGWKKDTDETEALAWGLLQQMLGDPDGAIFNKIESDTVQVQRACDLANERYEKLVSKRVSAGLPPYEGPPAFAHVDIGRFGELCESWPVSRLQCRPGRDEGANIPVYSCSP